MKNLSRLLWIICFCLSLAFVSVSHASPVAVDLASLPQWFGGTTVANASMPGRIAVGDFDCDGQKDLIFGAPEIGLNRGRVFVYFGSSGFSGSTRLSDSYMDVVIKGNELGESLGRSILAHDVDGDGCDDLVVLAADAGISRTVIHTIYGGHSWSSGFNDNLSAVSSYDTLPNSVTTRFDRLHLLGAVDGDVTGDGKVDGRDAFVAVCGGETCFLIAVKDLSASSSDWGKEAMYRILGSSSKNDNILSADIDGDGHEDLLISSYSEFSIYSDSATIFYGPLRDSPSLLTDGAPYISAIL